MARAKSLASAKGLDALGLIGVRLVVSALVWSWGFRAVSDDDYARVVIAQTFAHAPSLDPSGTSWLPFPFWLHGSAMLAFGRSITTAAVTAWLSGVASTLLVWTAARWIGLPRWPAFMAAVLASIFPHSAWLGVAMVPEQLTAGLVVIAAASLGSFQPSRRLWGGLCVGLATLSRYETWPVAALFAAFCVWDAVRQPPPEGRKAFSKRALLGSAALGIGGMIGWMLHGVLAHGSAVFFVRRVAEYQHALGGHEFDAWTALTRHPRLLFAEPELMFLACMGLVLWWARPRQEPSPLRVARPLLLGGSLLLFLMLGDLRGAGATHHSARVLLACWMIAALLVEATLRPELTRWSSRLLGQRLGRRADRVETAAAALPVVVVLLGFVVRLQQTSPEQSFVDRSEEISLGHHARQVAASGRLLIDSNDYGYFAMIAAFSAPERADTVDSHDPREHRKADPFDDPLAMGSRLKQRQVRALIAPIEKLAAAERLGRVATATPHYVLVTPPF